jgi:hypothetical protein
MTDYLSPSVCVESEDGAAKSLRVGVTVAAHGFRDRGHVYHLDRYKGVPMAEVKGFLGRVRHRVRRAVASTSSIDLYVRNDSYFGAPVPASRLSMAEDLSPHTWTAVTHFRCSP